MEDNLLILIGTYFLILFVIISFKGGEYDSKKREIQPNYKKNHVGRSQDSIFFFSIPWIIKDETNNTEINKLIKQYNKLVRIFWLSVLISIPIFYYILE